MSIIGDIISIDNISTKDYVIATNGTTFDRLLRSLADGIISGNGFVRFAISPHESEESAVIESIELDVLITQITAGERLSGEVFFKGVSRDDRSVSGVYDLEKKVGVLEVK